MLPSDLKAESFAGYPPEARAIAIVHIQTLRRLPMAFVPSLLREVIEFDYKFPVERSTIERELSTLDAISDAELHSGSNFLPRFHYPPVWRVSTG